MKETQNVLVNYDDKSFEIDMVIDSTSNILKHLELLAEEISMLQQMTIDSDKS